MFGHKSAGENAVLAAAANARRDTKDQKLDGAFTSDTMQAKIDEIGFGLYQVIALLCCGGVMFAEGSEVLVMGSITRLLADQWGLNAFAKGLMTAIVFVGFAIGNLVAGYLGDRFGRRASILISYLVIGTAGMITSTTTNAITMMFVRVFVGVGCGIGFPNVYSYIPEVCPTALRGVTSALMIGFMSIGELFAALVVYVIDPNLKGGPGFQGRATWRALVQLSALPAFAFFLLAFSLLHESPRYLLSHGQIDEVRRCLGVMARMNGHLELSAGFSQPGPAVATEHMQIASGAPSAVGESWVSRVGKAFEPRYARTTFILFLAHFTKDFSVFGLNYVFPQYFADSAGSMPVGEMMIFVSLLALPGVLLAVALTRLQMVGNITSLSFASGCCGIAAVGLLDCFDLIKCSYIVKFCAMAYFIITVVYTAEVFPTKIRVTGVGICTSAGRLGSISAPILFELLKQRTDSFNPFWATLISLMGVVSFSAICFLKLETKGVALVDNDDQEFAPKYASASKV